MRLRSSIPNTNDCVTSNGIKMMSAPLSHTIFALVGSYAILNSAVGVIFHQLKLHPIAMIFLSIHGLRAWASARLVIGHVHSIRSASIDVSISILSWSVVMTSGSILLSHHIPSWPCICAASGASMVIWLRPTGICTCMSAHARRALRYVAWAHTFHHDVVIPTSSIVPSRCNISAHSRANMSSHPGSQSSSIFCFICCEL